MSKCALYSNEEGISEADLGYEQICQCNRCYRCPPLRGKDCSVGNKSWFHPYSCGAYDEASKLHICGDCYTSCDFTASSFPMLLKKFVTKARRVEAEVFQHMLCENYLKIGAYVYKISPFCFRHTAVKTGLCFFVLHFSFQIMPSMLRNISQFGISIISTQL
jgi:hypothetical protein